MTPPPRGIIAAPDPNRPLLALLDAMMIRLDAIERVVTELNAKLTEEGQ